MATRDWHGRYASAATTAERFWAKVDAEGPCWEWTAARSPNGYGRFGVTHSHVVQAHRFAWELLVGPIPEGMELDHLCRNPRCVFPDHLQPVTMRENLYRGYGPSSRHKINRRKCPKGHLLTDLPSGRRCRICRAEYMRVKRAKRWQAEGRPGQPTPNAAKTHCPQGHPYDQANTYWTKEGNRMCRTCIRERARERRRRQR